MKQISDNVYQISLGVVNAFIVDGDGLTLIDTGTKNSVDKVFASIRKGGKNPEDIKRIILTHLHPDHSGSAAEFKKRLNVPVYAHPLDARLLALGKANRATEGVQMALSPGILNWLVYHLFIKRADKMVTPINVDELVNDGDVIPFAGGIDVIYTPGHSAGHIALLVRDEGVLIAGDICANVSGLGLSIVYEDRKLGVKSILRAADFDFDKAVFGHGGPLMSDANKKMREVFKQ
jgi:glyoxylase-like metal-dependent hydrolase (beta-lactamase superfamily II)